MIEVFKTNVENSFHADMLIDEIHQNFRHYSANFDLQDCDRILRIKSTGAPVESSVVINMLRNFGFHAEILPDEIVTMRDVRVKSSPIQLLQ